MPKAPYLLFGFDVDPDDPNADQIMTQVESGFPALDIGSLGVENAHYAEVKPSQADATYALVAGYLYTQGNQIGPTFRWFVQLCDTEDLVMG
jgi:hypothetical protein